jgi:hypothetical protein
MAAAIFESSVTVRGRLADAVVSSGGAAAASDLGPHAAADAAAAIVSAPAIARAR